MVIKFSSSLKVTKASPSISQPAPVEAGYIISRRVHERCSLMTSFSECIITFSLLDSHAHVRLLPLKDLFDDSVLGPALSLIVADFSPSLHFSFLLCCNGRRKGISVSSSLWFDASRNHLLIFNSAQEEIWYLPSVLRQTCPPIS